MGIKGFSAWLRSTFPHVFCPIPMGPSTGRTQTLHFDQVYVDLNPFLHTAARQSTSADQTLRHFRRSLKAALTQSARPSSFLYLAMDGAAPLAKLPEQRARRQESALAAARRGTFDAQQITPGCLFMTTVEAQVYGLARDVFFARPHGSQTGDFSCVIDGSASAGEGEFKIIRRLVRDHVDCDAHRGRVTRAILASDADLFLQVLLSDVPHVYVIDPFASGQAAYACFSVDRWKRTLAANRDEMTTRRMALDLALFALMSGSDYAPAIRFANYRSLWPWYLQRMREGEGVSGAENEDRLGNDNNNNNNDNNGNDVRAVKRTRYDSNTTQFIVDAERRTLNLEALRNFFQSFVRDGLHRDLLPGLTAHHETLDPTGRDERILNYAKHMLWNLDALITAHVTDEAASLLEDKSAPSLLELCEFDATALQVVLDAHVQTGAAGVVGEKLPGTIALMVLDGESDCSGYVATALQPFVRELKDAPVRLADAEKVAQLTARIKALPADGFTLTERLTTFPRHALTLSAKPIDGNFFVAAASANSAAQIIEESGSRLPWMRPYVYAVDEQEAWRCPLHRMLFGKYRPQSSAAV